MDSSINEIRQIVSCAGDWVAVFRNVETKETHEYPVACWALIIEHLDEDDKKSFEIEQFEFVRGMIAMQGSHNLIEPFEELGEGEEFIGYEKTSY